MARLLFTYFSSGGEVMYDQITTELLKNGNDVFRLNINNTQYISFDYWGGKSFIKESNILVGILKFDPEIILNFNNSCHVDILNVVSKKCKLCVLDADNPEFFWNKEVFDKYKKRFCYLGLQSFSLNLYQSHISKEIQEGMNYLFFPLATSIKRENRILNKNVYRDQFFPSRQPCRLTKGIL